VIVSTKSNKKIPVLLLENNIEKDDNNLEKNNPDDTYRLMKSIKRPLEKNFKLVNLSLDVE